MVNRLVKKSQYTKPLPPKSSPNYNFGNDDEDNSRLLPSDPPYPSNIEYLPGGIPIATPSQASLDTFSIDTPSGRYPIFNPLHSLSNEPDYPPPQLNNNELFDSDSAGDINYKTNDEQYGILFLIITLVVVIAVIAYNINDSYYFNWQINGIISLFSLFIILWRVPYTFENFYPILAIYIALIVGSIPTPTIASPVLLLFILMFV